MPKKNLLILLLILLAALFILKTGGKVTIYLSEAAANPSVVLTPKMDVSTIEGGANQKQTASPPASNRLERNQIPSENVSPEQAYCRLIAANVNIPLTGDLKIWSHFYSFDENGNAGFISLIHSSECPVGTFSKVRMDPVGRIVELIDCRSATAADLAISAGIQGNVMEKPSSGKSLNLAIGGPGYFVLECEDGVYLSRSGKFRMDRNQVFSGKCRVLAQDGSYFKAVPNQIDENGCTSTQSCIALVQPEDAASVEIVNRLTFRAVTDPLKSPSDFRRVFENNLEDLDNAESGPMGPVWDRFPGFRIPDCYQIKI